MPVSLWNLLKKKLRDIINLLICCFFFVVVVVVFSPQNVIYFRKQQSESLRKCLTKYFWAHFVSVSFFCLWISENAVRNHFAK